MRRLIRRIGDFLVELRRRKVYQATAIYLVLAVGALAATEASGAEDRDVSGSGEIAELDVHTVAVLPFENLSGASVRASEGYPALLRAAEGSRGG